MLRRSAEETEERPSGAQLTHAPSFMCACCCVRVLEGLRLTDRRLRETCASECPHAEHDPKSELLIDQSQSMRQCSEMAYISRNTLEQMVVDEN